MQSLNANYRIIQEAEFPHIKKWIGVLIDKHFKSNRLSVLNNAYFLQKLPQTLFSKEEFEKEWKLAYMAEEKNILKELEVPPTLEEENCLLRMDYCFYRTVVMTVYDFTLKEVHEKFHSTDSTPLREFLERFKNRPPFQLNTKREMAEKFYQSVDLMFMQEAGTVEWP